MSTLKTIGLLSMFALLGSVATSRAEIIHYCPPPTHYVVGSGCISWLKNPATVAYRHVKTTGFSGEGNQHANHSNLQKR